MKFFYSLLTAYYLPLSTYHFLLTTYCLLLTTYYLLFTIYCSIHRYDCATSKTLMDLSPVKFLYASEFDASKAKSVIEKLKDPATLDAYKKMGRCSK